MDLFEEIITINNEQNHLIETNHQHTRPKITREKLTIEENIRQRISSLAQYFLAPFILVSSNGILEIPITNENIEDIAMKEILPHFNKVTKVITNEKEVVLSLKEVKENSKIKFLNLIENHQINPIVNDIYSKDISNWQDTFPSKEYKVNLKAIRKSTKHDILPMWNFFEQSFIKTYGGMAILPSGWTFEESFKDRVSIQSFASVCSKMIVTVNRKNNMITSILIN